MTDETTNPDKELAMLSLRLITDVSDTHISSPGMHQVRLLADDLLGMIETDTLMVVTPITQEAVQVEDPEPWPDPKGDEPPTFWYPADPGPEATRAIANVLVDLASRPVQIQEARDVYRHVMVHVGEAVDKGLTSKTAVFTELQPLSDFKVTPPAPEPMKPAPLFMPGHPPLDGADRLRQMIHDSLGIDIGVILARKCVSELRVSDRAMEDIAALNFLEGFTALTPTRSVEVKSDCVVVHYEGDKGRTPDIFAGKPRFALKALRSAQKPE